jgi:hypothetical protein
MATNKRRKNARRRTIYGRVLMLKTLNPGPVVSFVFFEVAVTVAIVLALLGWVSWWGVLVLPLAVAAMVKVNDVIATATQRSQAVEQDLGPEPEPEMEPEPEPEPSGLSASREHRKAVRERSREEKRVARAEQKSAGRGAKSDDTTVIPAIEHDALDYYGIDKNATQTLPTQTQIPQTPPTQTPPGQRNGSDATQQLPVVPDELDSFMTEIRGNRPPPWDPAAAAPEPPTEPSRKRR